MSLRTGRILSCVEYQVFALLENDVFDRQVQSNFVNGVNFMLV